MSEILVPVSIGELVDKITILRIKEKRIDDAAKVANVKKELTALINVCHTHKIPIEDALVVELQMVNTELWDIEDEIRDKERAKQFDNKFIELARAVYVTNDKRFEAKSKINKKFGSQFVEEKSYKPY